MLDEAVTHNLVIPVTWIYLVGTERKREFQRWATLRPDRSRGILRRVQAS